MVRFAIADNLKNPVFSFLYKQQNVVKGCLKLQTVLRINIKNQGDCLFDRTKIMS